MKNTYSHIHPCRINPEFIGIGSRYIQEKQRRKTQQNRQKQLQNDYLRTIKTDKNLQKNISRKSLQLARLQQSRSIKLLTKQQKQEYHKQKMQQLDKLKHLNHLKRKTLKYKINSKKNMILNQNKQGWKHLKNTLSSIDESFKRQLEFRMQEKANRCKEIKEGQHVALNRVHTFYKIKNQESLNCYNEKISSQRRYKLELERKTRVYKKEMRKVNMSVQEKQRYLAELEEEITRYKGGAEKHKSVMKSSRKKLTEDDQERWITQRKFSNIYKNTQV